MYLLYVRVLTFIRKKTNYDIKYYNNNNNKLLNRSNRDRENGLQVSHGEVFSIHYNNNNSNSSITKHLLQKCMNIGEFGGAGLHHFKRNTAKSVKKHVKKSRIPRVVISPFTHRH
jgi:hypothetical protein